MPVTISIIIPCFNEVDNILNCIKLIRSNAFDVDGIEIIVADAGSDDGTLDVLKTSEVTVINCAVKCRAKQMNIGAAVAQGEILYFLHADTIPPLNFDKIILHTNLTDDVAGCFRLKFDYNHWFLKANTWFTKFDINSFRFGDQSLFIRRNRFELINGFNEKYVVFEDQEIIARIKKKGQFKVLPYSVVTSARMYVENGIYFTQLYYFYLFMLHKLGVNQQTILNKYKKKLGKIDQKNPVN